jgi:hypothetical protein
MTQHSSRLSAGAFVPALKFPDNPRISFPGVVDTGHEGTGLMVSTTVDSTVEVVIVSKLVTFEVRRVELVIEITAIELWIEVVGSAVTEVAIDVLVTVLVTAGAVET